MRVVQRLPMPVLLWLQQEVSMSSRPQAKQEGEAAGFGAGAALQNKIHSPCPLGPAPPSSPPSRHPSGPASARRWTRHRLPLQGGCVVRRGLGWRSATWTSWHLSPAFTCKKMGECESMHGNARTKECVLHPHGIHHPRQPQPPPTAAAQQPTCILPSNPPASFSWPQRIPTPSQPQPPARTTHRPGVQWSCRHGPCTPAPAGRAAS